MARSQQDGQPIFKEEGSDADGTPSNKKQRGGRRGSAAIPISPTVHSARKKQSELWERVLEICEPLFWRACCRDLSEKKPSLPVMSSCEDDDPDGICETTFEQTSANDEDGLTVAIFDREGVRFASKAYERAAHIRTATFLNAKALDLPMLMSHHEKPEVQLKRDGWRKLAQLHLDVLGVPLDGKAKSGARGSSAAPMMPSSGDLNEDAFKEKPIYRDHTEFTFGESDFSWPELIPILSEDADKEPFWQIVCAFGVELDDVMNIVWILIPLRASFPKLLWELLHHDERASNRRRCNLILDGVLSKLSEILCASLSKEHLGPAIMEAEKLCEHICRGFEREEAYFGDILVPRVGILDVQKYAHLSDMESKITADWKKDDLSYCPVSRHETNSKEAAWTLADPKQLDCPLVYMSSGFEDLTGYWRAQGLGRNCRFVQPKDGQRNTMYNGPEFGKISDFCKQDEGELLTFLLAERSTGQTIWQLLFLKHVYRKDPQSGESDKPHHYIFGLHTDVYSQREAIADILPPEPTEASVGALKELRMHFQEKINKFSFQMQSLHALADEVICEWLLKSGRDCRSCYIEGNFAPRIGLAPTRAFAQKSLYPDLMTASKEYFAAVHNPSADLFDKTLNDKEGGLAISIADPLAKDCPLVFVNRAWVALTGHTKEIALARSCRFLQPSFSRLNSVVNGEELRRVRAFSEEPDQPTTTGNAMLALLLNEQASGDRFWNFLYLVHLRVGNHRFVVGCSTRLDIHMPGVLLSREQSKWYDDEMGRTADEWGAFVTRLREVMRSKENPHLGNALLGPGGLAEMTVSVKEQILEYMKSSEDYEGDHFVPKIGMREVRQFREGNCWHHVYVACRAEVRRLTENPLWEGQDLSIGVVDPNGPGCPLVHVSRGFEELTGYHAEFALGRNSCFVQPKRGALNDLFNTPERKRMRNFCKGAAGPLDQKSIKGPLPDKRMVTLLVNTHRERFPFWCLLWLERVEACNKHFIIAVHTRVNAGGRLVELLAGDDAGLEQLGRLRALFLKRESCLSFESLTMVSKRCLEEWLVSYPPVLELPRMACQGMPWPFPLVGLEINAQNTDMPMLVDAMENGIRHFHITFPGYSEVKDGMRHEFEGRLMALRLAELLNRLRSHHLQYLRAGLCFSVRTPPHLVVAFAEIRKAVISNGMSIACWLLDARYASTKEVEESWAFMSNSKAIGEVRVIGLYGGGLQAANAVRAGKGTSNLSVYAAEMLPGVRVGKEQLDLFAQVRAGGGVIMAFNIFGHNNSWLLSEHVQAEAAKMQCDPTIFLLKWVEHRGFAALVPSLGAEAMHNAPHTLAGIWARPPIKPQIVAAVLAADPTLATVPSKRDAPAPLSPQTLESGSDALPGVSGSPQTWKKKDWTPRSPKAFEGFFHLKTSTELAAQIAQNRGEANVHRGFVRAYRQSPSAEVCSFALSGDTELSQTESNRRRTFCIFGTEDTVPTVDVDKQAQSAALRPGPGTGRRASSRLTEMARLSTATARLGGMAHLKRATIAAARDTSPRCSRQSAKLQEVPWKSTEFGSSPADMPLPTTTTAPAATGLAAEGGAAVGTVGEGGFGADGSAGESRTGGIGRPPSSSGPHEGMAESGGGEAEVVGAPREEGAEASNKTNSDVLGDPAHEHFPMIPVQQGYGPELPPLVVLWPQYPSPPQSARPSASQRRRRQPPQQQQQERLGSARSLGKPQPQRQQRQQQQQQPGRRGELSLPAPRDRPNTRTAWQRLAARAAVAEGAQTRPSSVGVVVPPLSPALGFKKTTQRMNWQLLETPAALPNQRGSVVAGGGGGGERRDYRGMLT
mmetsp:Transcript_72793/g.236447  ORF Transcript_72793/g.236447 Transcript_72793/m.236447 type:complete len:1814 (-) Transcript_72793:37-5478(-)